MLPFLLLLSLFCSCSGGKGNAEYVQFGTEAVGFVRQDGILLVVKIPSSLKDRLPSLFGVEGKIVGEMPEENRRELDVLWSALERECGMEDGLSAARREVSFLSKTRFPETLERLTGRTGLWKEMKRCRKWYLYDLSDILKDGDVSDVEDYLKMWFSGAVRAAQRS